MVKRNKKIKSSKNSKNNKKSKKDKKHIHNLETENDKEENKADFYLDDADADLAYNSSELEESNNNSDLEEDESDEGSLSKHGSELDFNESEYSSEEEKQKSSEKTKKAKQLSKEALKKLLIKVGNGIEMSITRFLIIVGRLTNPNTEVNYEDNDEGENVLTQSKYINRILKYYIIELPNILQMKINKENENKTSNMSNIIKRYISILIRYIKTCEQGMKNMIFLNIENIAPLIFIFNNFTEIILKIAINLWSTTSENEIREKIINFIKLLFVKKPKFFEYSIKIFYINYLNVAKEMNIKTFSHIKQLQDDIINILNYDLQKAYTTIFTFIRKLCIQLRGTIVEKTTATIKSIYNWQFVNSLILWSRVIMKYISNEDIRLLIYPMIQTIIGVIKLNYGEQYYLLRIRLVMLLNGISRVSNIFIPTQMYILPILSSNYFIEKCKNNINNNLENKKADKNKNKGKINNRVVINVSLKIKKEEWKIKQIRKDLLEECCDCLTEFLSINSNKICFAELACNILKEMRSALKNIYDKEYREIVKKRIEKIEKNISNVRENISSNYNKSILLTEPGSVEEFEKQNITDFSKEWINIRHRRQATFEAIKSQKENKFIEV